jgi:hypothetical protein
MVTDEALAPQFRTDLIRLIEASTQSAGTPAADRWAIFLGECERSFGRPLTVSVFGPLAQGAGLGTGGSPASEDPEPAGGDLTPSERAAWARWAVRLAAAVTGQGAEQPPLPLAYRTLATRIVVQLLADGVWEPGDAAWREVLARLAASLVPGPGDDEPANVRHVAAALAALCMGLLRTGASLTGGSSPGALAARSWTRLKPLVAEADPDLVADLLMPPVHAHAVTLNLSELEEIVLLAMDDDPAAVLMAEFAGRGWQLESDGLMYRVTGPFTNPLSVAAQVATHLGASLGSVLVRAQAGERWTFIAWRRPDLLLASVPGHAWRVYRIDGSATPESRFAGADGIPSAGLVGRPVPFAKGLPPAGLELLGAVGADPVEVLTHVISGGRG